MLFFTFLFERGDSADGGAPPGFTVKLGPFLRKLYERCSTKQEEMARRFPASELLLLSLLLSTSLLLVKGGAGSSRSDYLSKRLQILQDTKDDLESSAPCPPTDRATRVVVPAPSPSRSLDPSDVYADRDDDDADDDDDYDDDEEEGDVAVDEEEKDFDAESEKAIVVRAQS